YTGPTSTGPTSTGPTSTGPASTAPTSAGPAAAQPTVAGQPWTFTEPSQESRRSSRWRGASPFRSRAASPRNGRWVSIAAAAVVVLIAAASAVILIAHPGTPSRNAADSGHRRSPGASPSTTIPATASPDIAVAAAAAKAPQLPAVVGFLSQYFTAINQHDFAAYEQLYSPRLRGGLSAASFLSGYGSSIDSLATLRRVVPVGADEVDAAVTFTSHQQPSASPSHSACTTWRISLYLTPESGKYEIVPPPAGYKARFRRCG
ncbi:MAG TPA: hypothetical protein VK823_02005, partial [Streptosporangiaceae bacterium]|nr:hypothetical protein [Streptosporangiaceae bacterium]